MTPKAPGGIVWLRRDLRTADNPALRQAARECDTVLAVYIHAPDEQAPWQPGGASAWWLHESLGALREALRERGGELLLRTGASLDTLRALVRLTGARHIYWNRLYEPALVERDRRVKDALGEDGVVCRSFRADMLFEPREIQTGDGGPYRVFTPFSRACAKRLPVEAPLPAVRQLPPPPPAVANGRVPKGRISELGLLPAGAAWHRKLHRWWTPGEAGARRRLKRFLAPETGTVAAYGEGRDRPAEPGTAGLSPHLHFGEISPRQIAHAVESLPARAALQRNADAWLRQVLWREFARHLLFHFPRTPVEPLRERFRRFPWRRGYRRDLRRWQQGRTGVPLVDAGMRELWETGWMHNRVRMVVASFLTKHLLIPWQEGARWFWDTLVDADLANNTMGWQWVAGCGADAAPYFRVFNPVTQGERFDPGGDYVRRWVGELQDCPARHIHSPWGAKAGWDAAAAGYPQRMVDLKAGREAALRAYEKIKEA